MKKPLIILSLLPILISNHFYSQTTPPGPPNPFVEMQTPGENYFSIINRAQDFYAQTVGDTSENGPSVGLARWEWFWKNRVYKGDSVPGSFKYGNPALLNFFQNPICSGPGPFISNWQSLGPNSLSSQQLGAVWKVAVDPSDPNPANPNVVYAGTPNSGLFRTTNFSNVSPTWTNLTDNLRMPFGINDIVFDPANSNIMYLATGVSRSGAYGIGIIKTINASAAQPTWIAPSSGLNLAGVQEKQVFKIIIDPSSPIASRTMYALVKNEVWKSVDSGDNWNMLYVIPDPDLTNWTMPMAKDIEISPTNPNVLFLTSSDWNSWNGGGKLYKSVDAGLTWNDITNNLTLSNDHLLIEIDYSDVSPNSLFVYYVNTVGTVQGNDDQAHLQRSIDDGVTYIMDNRVIAIASPDISSSNFSVSDIDPNIFYFWGGVNFYKTDVAALTPVTQITGPYHVDVRDLVLSQPTAWIFRAS